MQYSPHATALYLLLSGFFGADKKLAPDTVRVPMRVIARWLHCTSRTAQRAVQELTRSGPLPLILEKPGRPGQVSEDTFVRDPFKVAAMQEVEAVRNKAKRGAAIVAAQAEIHAAESRGDITPAGAAAKLKATALRRTWNTPMRGAVVVSLDAQEDAPSPGPDVPIEQDADAVVTACIVPDGVASNEAQDAETPQHVTDLRNLKERLGVNADTKRF